MRAPMKTISSSTIYDVLIMSLPHLATSLPEDVSVALNAARDEETNERARYVLDQLVENAHIASGDRVPVCQDAGTVWVCLEVGPDISLDGNIFSKVNEAVARSYEHANLRKSLVADALFNRTNTETNTPAFCDLRIVDEPGVARVHIMLKGGGADNASRIVMLPPNAGKEGVKDVVLSAVREAGINACPPLILGVGVGGTFDRVAALGKAALMRPIGTPSAHRSTGAFERELLEEVNALGIGAAGMGGNHTALAVHVNTAPSHMASLPVAVCMGCSAMRRATVEV